jgi:hypothetical protein
MNSDNINIVIDETPDFNELIYNLIEQNFQYNNVDENNENDNENDNESDNESDSEEDNIEISTSLAISRLLEETFYDRSQFKQVLSEEGEKNLHKIIYNHDLSLNIICPIMQTDLENGMPVIQLDCKHCFIPEAINKWLKEEKAECPVCRFALDSKEIKDNSIQNNTYRPHQQVYYRIATPHYNIIENEEEEDQDEDEEDQDEEERPRTRRRITNTQEEEELQLAIINSLLNPE